MAPAQGIWDALSWRMEYRDGSEEGLLGEGVLVLVFDVGMIAIRKRCIFYVQVASRIYTIIYIC